MASMVTTVPDKSSKLSKAGMAVISFDLSATHSCARTERAQLAKALTSPLGSKRPLTSLKVSWEGVPVGAESSATRLSFPPGKQVPYLPRLRRPLSTEHRTIITMSLSERGLVFISHRGSVGSVKYGYGLGSMAGSPMTSFFLHGVTHTKGFE